MLILVGVVLTLSASAQARAEPLPTAVVMTLAAKQGTKPDVAEMITASLATRVRASEKFSRVIAAAEVESTLGFERQKQLIACDSQSCAAEVAAALGVDYLIGGHLGRVGSYWVLNVFLVNLRTAQTEFSVNREVPGQDEGVLLVALPAVTQELLSKLGAAPSPGVVQPSSAAQSVATVPATPAPAPPSRPAPASPPAAAPTTNHATAEVSSPSGFSVLGIVGKGLAGAGAALVVAGGLLVPAGLSGGVGAAALFGGTRAGLFLGMGLGRAIPPTMAAGLAWWGVASSVAVIVGVLGLAVVGLGVGVSFLA